jgi:predicted nuclease with TOPRIM domain
MLAARADAQRRKWLEREVSRLTTRAKELEEHLSLANTAGLSLLARIEQLEVSCRGGQWWLTCWKHAREHIIC